MANSANAIEGLRLHVPIRIGNDRTGGYVTLVQDYLGEAPEILQSEAVVETSVFTHQDEELFSFVAEKTIDAARDNGADVPIYGVAQLVLENGWVDLDAKDPQLYTVDIGNEATLYFYFDPQERGLNKKIKCIWGYGGKRPPDVKNLPLQSHQRLDIRLANLIAPRVELFTDEEMSAKANKASQRLLLAGVGALFLGFVFFLGIGLVNFKINQMKIEKSKALDNQIILLETQISELSKTKMPKTKDSTQDIAKLAELFLIDKSIATSKREGKKPSFQEQAIAIISREAIPVDLAAHYPWLRRVQYMNDGGSLFEIMSEVPYRKVNSQ